jgi:hypothetical protein
MTDKYFNYYVIDIEGYYIKDILVIKKNYYI